MALELELVTTPFDAAVDASLVVGLVSALETPLLGALALAALNVLFEANARTISAEPASDCDEAEASESGAGAPSDASGAIGIWTLRGAAWAAAPALEPLASAEAEAEAEAESASIESTTLWRGLRSRFTGDVGSDLLWIRC